MVLEPPGSPTFEIPNLPALSEPPRVYGIKVIVGNSWRAGLLYKSLGLGVDVSVQVLTKNVSGHVDALGAAILSNTSKLAHVIYSKLRLSCPMLAPNDAYFLLRVLRTLPMRLKLHEANG